MSTGGDETIANAAEALLSLRNGTTYSETTTGITTTIARRCYSERESKKRASRSLLRSSSNSNTSKTYIDKDHTSLLLSLQHLALDADTLPCSWRTLPSPNSVLSKRHTDSTFNVVPLLLQSETPASSQAKLTILEPDPIYKMSENTENTENYYSFFEDNFFDFNEASAFYHPGTCSLDDLLNDHGSGGLFNDCVDDQFSGISGETPVSVSEPVTSSGSEPVTTSVSEPTVHDTIETSSDFREQFQPVLPSFILPQPPASKERPASKKPKIDGPIDLTSDSPLPQSTGTTPQQSASSLPPVATNGLRFTSLAEAQKVAEARTPLEIRNDDWAAMDANPYPHVLRIMAAFTGKLRDQPERYENDKNILREFALYQARSLDRVLKITLQDPSRIELSAWLIFGELIDHHKQGAKPTKANSTAQPGPAPMKCSEHLEALCQPICDYAIFRFDLLRNMRIDELVANVEGAKTRKLCNFKGNGRKSERDVENAQRAAELGLEYDKVLGSRRKRGRGEGEPAMKRLKKAESVVAAAEMGFGDMTAFSGGQFFEPAAAVGGAQSSDVLGMVAQSDDFFAMVGGLLAGDVGHGQKRMAGEISTE